MPAFPGVARVTARLSATRRDRITAHLPMLRQPHPEGAECAVEVRAFVGDWVVEDPVTGSLNAGLARWLTDNGWAPERYVAAQGTVLGRTGRVLLERDADTVWVGGQVSPVVRGTVEL